jgi:uncharacterized protein YndB with AHSA1/START domain
MTTSKALHAHVKQAINKPVSEVFDAIVNPGKMAKYFITSASAPMKDGAEILWKWDDAGAEATIKVGEVKANELITYTWPASGLSTEVRIELEKVSESATLVKVTETGWDLNAGDVQRALQQTEGWTNMLLCLKAYLHFGVDLRRG